VTRGRDNEATKRWSEGARERHGSNEATRRRSEGARERHGSDEATRRRDDETTRDKSKLMGFKEKQQIKK
jgi:hypothetical protein